MRILVTGGCGFIGSHLVRKLLRDGFGPASVEVLNLDKLTYAAAPQTLVDLQAHPAYHFCHGDVADGSLVGQLLADFRPDAVMHLAAESHVDRSIDSPAAFMQTNIVGTYQLLEACRAYWMELPLQQREKFRYLHVSTDEVYGSLEADGLFTESTAYDPHSPYAASKAAADHLVRAWYTTYGLPILVTNCSNNYGPYQFPEKLIPHMILSAVHGQVLPVYGDGNQVRDWLYVEDHVSGLELVCRRGAPGETYNLGGHCPRRNLELVQLICDHLDKVSPRSVGSYHQLIRFVPDRPGHDRRYAIDASKIKRELGWHATTDFVEGLSKTVEWYLSHDHWWQEILQGVYCLQRLGTGCQQTNSPRGEA